MAELKGWRVTVTKDGAQLSMTWTGFIDAIAAREYLEGLEDTRRTTRP